MSTLRLILGDQLTPDISSLRDADKSNDIILLCEVFAEAVYVKHHQKKIAFLFSAMRHFAAKLSESGWHVDYVRLDQKGNSHSFSGEVVRAVARHEPQSVIVTCPSEWRVLEEMRNWETTLPCAVELRDDDRFYCTLDEFASWAEGRKQLRMEYFYRELRRKTGILMSENEPIGGQWNYDAENRGRAPDDLEVPKRTSFVPDDITNEVLHLVENRFGAHFGRLRPFEFAVTHEQAAYVLDRFIAERLPLFGIYQDAMVEGEAFMFHAHIGLYLNCGLLSPQQAIIAAENAYHAGAAPLNATEGFIRQILGWREFVRGLYWLKMPDYADQNALEAHRPLPAFFWTADTKMNCLKQCVSETRDHAYAHHIQRLMVLGNFALLAGLSPKDVNEWFMIVYADAYEWVELPNVSGMALYADGGVLASKPYASGGAYIERMSNYCRSCHYNVKQKTGEQACPFNYLYWDFLIRHQDRLSSNARMGMMYRTLSKMTDEKRATILADSQRFLSELS
ncbi:MAG: cryptochrome/photolyase family protein [Alphaproteobacteria bacterium]|nr:cryptochrome/photolyase family protein [Alphaproteobacteria bacterium]